MNRFGKAYSWPRLKFWMLTMSGEGCISVSFMRNMRKDPHTQSIIVFEFVENKTGIILSLCPSWTEKILQNKNMSNFLPEVQPEHELSFSLHHKLSQPWKKVMIFVFFNYSLQVRLSCKSLQLMRMILHMGTVLKLSTAFSRDNHISLLNLRQVRGPYLSFWDNVCNSKWCNKPS